MGELIHTIRISDAAVKETEGLVLKYNGMLIDAVFSASNGEKLNLMQMLGTPRQFHI